MKNSHSVKIKNILFEKYVQHFELIPKEHVVSFGYCKRLFYHHLPANQNA